MTVPDSDLLQPTKGRTFCEYMDTLAYVSFTSGVILLFCVFQKKELFRQYDDSRTGSRAIVLFIISPVSPSLNNKAFCSKRNVDHILKLAFLVIISEVPLKVDIRKARV